MSATKGVNLDSKNLEGLYACWLPVNVLRKVTKPFVACPFTGRTGKGELTCLLILLLLCCSTASKPMRARTGPGVSPCANRCSQSCDRLCGTPQFSRCCTGLYTKRSIAEGKVTSNFGYSYHDPTRKLQPNINA